MAVFTQKVVTTKSGNDFTLQHPGIRNVTKINDRVKNKYGVISEEKVADEMLNHVVVSPKMKIDDFESYKEMMEVVNKAYLFIAGADDEEVSEDADQQD